MSWDKNLLNIRVRDPMNYKNNVKCKAPSKDDDIRYDELKEYFLVSF